MTVDSEADSPDSAKQKLSYTREWNTVDFVGKCKHFVFSDQA
jgi:hypothetical protein